MPHSNAVSFGLCCSFIFAFTLYSRNAMCQKTPHEMEYIHATSVAKIKTKSRVCRYKTRRCSYSIKEYHNDMLNKVIYYNNKFKLNIRAVKIYKYEEISDTLWSIQLKSNFETDTLSMKIHFIKDTCIGVTYGNQKTLRVTNIARKLFIESGNKSITSKYQITKDTVIRDIFYDDKHIEHQCYVYDNDKLTSETKIITDTTAVIADVIPWSKKRQYAYTIKYDKFDKHGNWTRSYYVQENGRRKFRSKRKITYYE